MGVGCPFCLYIRLILCGEDSGINQSQITLFKLPKENKTCAEINLIKIVSVIS